MVARAGIPIIDTKFVTVGGGIGSFVTVDFLRIYGVPASDITVLTQLETPWSSYEYLTRVSQIPRKERLRSDSKSTPDNIWGFPSYAVREAFGAKSIKGFVAPLWNVLTEPILSDYYTPKAGQAFETMEREHDRIGYPQCVRKGQVRMVRRRREGGYFTILTPPQGATPTRRLAYRSPYVHVAIGYPGPQVAARPAALPRVLPGSVQGGQRLRAARARLPATRAAARHRGHPRRRHRRLPGAAAADRRPGPARPADPDHPRLPHLHHRRARAEHLQAPQGRRRLGLPGLQLPEVGVGRPAQGQDPRPRGRGAGQGLQGDGRHQHARSASSGSPSSSGVARRAGTAPSPARSPNCGRARTARAWSPT